MQHIILPLIGTVAAWRDHARRLAASGVPSDALLWRVGDAVQDLFAEEAALPAHAAPRPITLGRGALDDLETALCHSDPERFARAYQLVLDLSDNRVRWGDRSHAAMRKVMEQAKSVRRHIHKMHAFVRFRELAAAGPRRRFAAWFTPEHPIIERGAVFFANRFGDMDWVIATPLVTARFAERNLSFEATGDVAPPQPDAAEELWLTYYASIFNPARVMVKAMQSEMPRKYWNNLPEAALIPDLVRGAGARVRDMAEREATQPPARRAAVARAMAARPVPDAAPAGSLAEVKAGMRSCTRCPLHGPATQTVCGSGPQQAALMVVGEQPGDHEDLSGLPFVGPAGKLLRREAAMAGIDLESAYLTNAVKHFKFQPRGKRRLHQSPTATEIDHCRWWLDQERHHVQPRLILALGGSALGALTGNARNITQRRGQIEYTAEGQAILPTFHPSYLLRLPAGAPLDHAVAVFRSDLALCKNALLQGDDVKLTP